MIYQFKPIMIRKPTAAEMRSAADYAHNQCAEREAFYRQQWSGSNYRCTDEEFDVFFSNYLENLNLIIQDA